MANGAPFLIDDWLELVSEKRSIAEASLNLQIGRQVQEACGFGMEFALKASIMRHEGLNSWPVFGQRKDLHTHDLPKLMALAGLTSGDIPVPLRPNFRLSLNWRRDFSYSKGTMSKVAMAQLFDAAYGLEGAVTWLVARI